MIAAAAAAEEAAEAGSRGWAGPGSRSETLGFGAAAVVAAVGPVAWSGRHPVVVGPPKADRLQIHKTKLNCFPLYLSM